MAPMAPIAETRTRLDGPPHRPSRRSGRRWWAAAGAVVVVAALIGYAVRPGGLAGSSGGDGEGSAGQATRGPAEVEAVDEVSGVAEGAPAPAEEAATFGAAASLQPALDGARVVKTARLSVLVPRGGFADAFDEASLVASRFGGFVQSSETQGADARSGRLVLRVPVASFDQALQAVRALGRVTGESTQGQDVTAQFVDLQARIRTWEAQEAVLLRLMDQSRTVGDTLRVQRELQGVQLEIERLKGQLQVITDQTDMSTISVSIREPGSPLETQQEDDRLTLIDAWRAAVDGFLGVVYAVIVGLGYLVPLGTLAGIGWLVFRRIRRSA